ncbi:Peptidyl-tRNA hydrolase [Sedimentisphaera cyanobacteriorum]|uniref:Peptidyl-tRNA hydrolase n=1 Tax=Sedimentisphaera cyanobacteriorum TaxID=1940790 RepID=A0A1Q2HN38_9BACT|nr:aminoacyl-tRNA hydrolase [Sedimentisphaera cyanobacteriorum]AQQ08626.1 Peptidyl-tRNA hydrolase [Sedimentisphaera cyanobacteriorum]
MACRLIAGLGNPGKKYEGTRHNIGFDVLDRFAEKCGVSISGRKFSSLCEIFEFGGDKIILLKPQTFMNLSGQAVAAARGFYKIDISDVLIIADDMAIDTGRIRLRPSGSAGGHNGLKDIIAKLGSQDFPRLRVGIGKSPLPNSTGYVLGRPSPEQRQELQLGIGRAVECIEMLIKDGLEKAMTEYNSKN